MMNFTRIAALILTVVLLAAACIAMQAKRPAFKKTVWACERKIFVADAGTMTETLTLELMPRGKCVLRSSWVMPAHPATYINADGSLDTIPESSSQSENEGTWHYFNGVLTVTLAEDWKMIFHYKDDSLVTNGVLGEPEAVFTKVAGSRQDSGR